MCKFVYLAGLIIVRAIARGGSGGSAEPPLQINDIHDYCYALEKLRAEMYVLIFFMHVLRIT